MIYAIILLIVTILAILWANGIDNMKENHPDYKGEDFLNEVEYKIMKRN